MARRLSLRDMAASQEELRLAKEAEAAPGQGQAIGGVIGSGVGALASIPSFGALAPVLTPLAGAAGSLIGGAIGQSDAEQKNERLSKLNGVREGKLARLARQQEARARFLAV